MAYMSRDGEYFNTWGVAAARVLTIVGVEPLTKWRVVTGGDTSLAGDPRPQKVEATFASEPSKEEVFRIHKAVCCVAAEYVNCVVHRPGELTESESDLVNADPVIQDAEYNV